MKELLILNTQLPAEYKSMMERVTTALPVIRKESEIFFKSNSQFANMTIDVTDLTPFRTMQRLMAEVEKARCALQEAYFNESKKVLEAKIKEEEAITQSGTRRELTLLEAREIKAGIEMGKPYIQSAIRKLSFMISQYDVLKRAHGAMSEEEYENEEIKYHIMTALKQALCSARTRNGTIDEGNSIYFFELGINGAHVQAEMFHYLSEEGKLLADGKVPNIQFTLNWMEQCAEMWKDCPRQLAATRGLTLMDLSSMHPKSE